MRDGTRGSQEACPPRNAQDTCAPRYLAWVLRLAGALCFGAVLIVLCYQVPATHRVDIGGYDAAYVRGFHDPQDMAYGSQPYVQGSDGRVRWSRARSFLVFPQAGQPATITLRLRGWRPASLAIPAPQVGLWLNANQHLATLTVGNDWQTYIIPIRGGLLKASDVVLELRSTPVVLPDEGREVGILLDRVTYRVAAPYITPYPFQVLYGALVSGLLLLVLQTHVSPWRAALGCVVGSMGVALAFLALTRLQPVFYPYPLHGLLPTLVPALAALLFLAHAPPLLVRRPMLVHLLALVGVLLWLGAVWRAAGDHLTLSVPGVEKDFRVFATRATDLANVFQADGFYHLGYPLLLWLVRPLTADNSFLAARLIAAISGAVLLLASYGMAQTLLIAHESRDKSWAALLAPLLLATSPLVVQYALYIGSDMPFAALTALSLALFVAGAAAIERCPRRAGVWLWFAGGAAGCAFLMRHPGLVLLPWGVLSCLWLHRRRKWAVWWALLFAGGFILAAMPQFVVNTTQTGELLYSQQAKNIWLAVYGGVDWGRWGEVPDSITLREIILPDPIRFFGNWWHNIVGFVGSGAEESGESGRAVQLRLLAFPANWLAVVGLIGWLRARAQNRPTRAPRLALLLFVVLYVLAICVGFILPRFFLPLAPVYAVAGAWTVQTTIVHLSAPGTSAATLQKRTLAALLILLVLLHHGVALGSRLVLEHQPADEQAIVRLALDTLPPGECILAHVSPLEPIHKYSALAHRVVTLPAMPDEQAILEAAQGQGINYLLWDEATAPLPLAGATAEPVGSAGRYRLYRLRGL